MFNKLERSVFQPGNLIHGLEVNPQIWRNLVQEGIRPFNALPEHKFGRGSCSDAHGRASICMMLFSELRLPDRYRPAHHHGPTAHRENDTWNSVGIVLSRERILRDFPEGELIAVGRGFDSSSYIYDPKLFKYTAPDKVYDIPIRPRIVAEESEVRLKSFRRGRRVSLPIEYWEGIVIHRSFLNRFYDLTMPVDINKDLPIFDPRCKFIDYR